MIITGGIYKGRKVNAPSEKITRPTLSKVRMGVFNTLYSMTGDFEDKNFLDLFGGSGIMGLEAISRGFKKVTVVEKNLKAASIITKNYESLGLIPNLITGDSLKYLKSTGENFDIIYIDPPYESGLYEMVFPLIKQNTLVILEHSEPIVSGMSHLKEKNYGGKLVTFIQF